MYTGKAKDRALGIFEVLPECFVYFQCILKPDICILIISLIICNRGKPDVFFAVAALTQWTDLML